MIFLLQFSQSKSNEKDCRTVSVQYIYMHVCDIDNATDLSADFDSQISSANQILMHIYTYITWRFVWILCREGFGSTSCDVRFKYESCNSLHVCDFDNATYLSADFHSQILSANQILCCRHICVRNLVRQVIKTIILPLTYECTCFDEFWLFMIDI